MSKNTSQKITFETQIAAVSARGACFFESLLRMRARDFNARLLTGEMRAAAVVASL